MFITPRVVESELDLRAVVDDLRRRMEKLDDTFDVFKKILNPATPVTQ